MKKSILFVDDEKPILNSFKRLFIKTDYNVYLAISAADALSILKKQKIDMIISDVKMPQIDGYSLLNTVKEKYPNTIRIILSGYIDKKDIIKAVQNNIAKIYLLKPWDNKDLISLVNRLFNVRKTLNDIKIFDLLEKCDNIPTIPDIYTNVTNLIKQEAPIEKISRSIEEDQSLTLKILQITNCAFYHIKPASIKDAILYLGLDTIKNIMLTVQLFDFDNIFPINNSKLKVLWKHSSVTNSLVQFLYSNIYNKKIPNNYFIAGLLHDIGKLIFINNYPKEYDKILQISNNVLVETEEKQILGLPHSILGAHLLNWYDFPYAVVEAATFHHIPTDSNIINKKIVSLVHISNHYSWKILNKQPEQDLNIDTLKVLNITPVYLDNLIENFKVNLTI